MARGFVKCKEAISQKYKLSGKSVQKDREKEVAEWFQYFDCKSSHCYDWGMLRQSYSPRAMFSFLLLLTRIPVAVILQ